MLLLENIWYFLLTICILVVFHEYGHYKVAKLCGVKVLQFSVGFGPVLFKWRYRGTNFVYSLLPLGGYVKMLDKTTITANDDISQSYDNKTTIQKIAILFAGPLFNFILAFIVYWLIAIIGKNQILPVIDSPFPGSVAEQAGLKRQDTIVAIDNIAVANVTDLQFALIERIGDSGFIDLQVQGQMNLTTTEVSIPIDNWLQGTVQPRILEALGISLYRQQTSLSLREVVKNSRAAQAGLEANDIVLSIDGVTLVNWQHFVHIIRNNPEKAMLVSYLRNASIFFTKLRPKQMLVKGENIGLAGVSFDIQPIAKDMLQVYRTNPVSALLVAFKETMNGIKFTIISLEKLLVGAISLKSLGGPITIAQYATDSAAYGVVPYLTLLALLSISLGIVNLLPVPVLDGGRIVLCLIEAIKGRPLSQAALQINYLIGFIFVLGLMVFVISNDLMRL